MRMLLLLPSKIMVLVIYSSFVCHSLHSTTGKAGLSVHHVATSRCFLLPKNPFLILIIWLSLTRCLTTLLWSPKSLVNPKHISVRIALELLIPLSYFFTILLYAEMNLPVSWAHYFLQCLSSNGFTIHTITAT